eukprot:TRINITY_DN30753_c0_g1_i1.p1 TRINITY_DN30753_c0_g1~~TRINITY_DN30753_c0_g1_i1.p1  ORF type:complete len:245 (+),score=30.40 TRINITY_DN30753_c0_g1_i1:60-737(+)
MCIRDRYYPIELPSANAPKASTFEIQARTISSFVSPRGRGDIQNLGAKTIRNMNGGTPVDHGPYYSVQQLHDKTARTSKRGGSNGQIMGNSGKRSSATATSAKKPVASERMCFEQSSGKKDGSKMFWQVRKNNGRGSHDQHPVANNDSWSLNTNELYDFLNKYNEEFQRTYLNGGAGIKNHATLRRQTGFTFHTIMSKIRVRQTCIYLMNILHYSLLVRKSLIDM